MVETLSIAVIGAPGVGKTSIIRQFIYNDFSEVYTPTRSRYVYRPSVILNGNMYELKVLDVPPISSFPSSSSQVHTSSTSNHQYCSAPQTSAGTSSGVSLSSMEEMPAGEG